MGGDVAVGIGSMRFVLGGAIADLLSAMSAASRLGAEGLISNVPLGVISSEGDDGQALALVKDVRPLHAAAHTVSVATTGGARSDLWRGPLVGG